MKLLESWIDEFKYTNLVQFTAAQLLQFTTANAQSELQHFQTPSLIPSLYASKSVTTPITLQQNDSALA